MATQEGIRLHDQLLNRVVDSFQQGLQPLISELFTQLANLGVTQDRTAIAGVFVPLRSYLRTQINALDSVTNSIVEINSDTIAQPLDANTLSAIQTIKTQTYDTVDTAITTEQNNLINTIVLAAIAGSATTTLFRQLRQTLENITRRIATVFTTSVFEFNSAITRLRARLAGIKTYKYVGGTIATSRDFCVAHNNKIYTEAEIKRIWQQKWGGKAPGDPFVVRGGYNCRHHWIPVVEENFNAA